MTQAIEVAHDQTALDLSPRMVVSLNDLKENLRELDQFKREIMVEGVDFGTIPGTPKPTLLKPGAEKLSLAFGLAPSFEHANRIEDWDKGFFHYEERCILVSRRSGQTVATANGSANSREPRYRWRNSGGTCVDCGHDVKRRRDGGAWCPRDDGGCGKNYSAAEAPARQRVENPEPYELCNTILKMAQKRALVAAILIATGGSGIWTQDIEDMPSVAGDQIIEADFREAPAPPRDDRSTIRSADDPVWKRWLETLAEAQSLNVPAPQPHLPMARAELIRIGTVTAAKIKERKAHIPADFGARPAPNNAASPAPQGAAGEAPPADSGPAAGAPDPADAPDMEVTPLALNQQMWLDANSLGLREIGHLKADGRWSDAKITEANNQLEQRLRAAGKQEQAF